MKPDATNIGATGKNNLDKLPPRVSLGVILNEIWYDS